MTAIVPGSAARTVPPVHVLRDEAPADGGVVVALAQLGPRLGDVAWNLGRHLSLIEEARRGGAHMVMFPEL